jgi:uncharacterized protein YjcR
MKPMPANKPRSGNRGGAPKGNRNAYKHGRYSAEHRAFRRRISALLREVRGTLRSLPGRGGGVHRIER